MAVDLANLLDQATKEISRLESRKKELESAIKSLTGELMAAKSEHQKKMAEFRAQSEKELKAIEAENEPMRITKKSLIDELAALRSDISKAKQESSEVRAARNVHAKESTAILDKMITAKRRELDGLNNAVSEVKRKFGVN